MTVSFVVLMVLAAEPSGPSLPLEAQEDQVATTTVKGAAGARFTLVVKPQHGGATLDAKTGALSYTPAANYNGRDELAVEVREGATASRTTVAISVNAVNDAPVAQPLKLTLKEDQSGSGTVAANDLDGDALTYSIDPEPAKGFAKVSSAGVVTFTPGQDAFGVERFGVLVSDGTTTTKVAVEADVRPVNDVPVVADAALSGAEDATASVTMSATDADGDALTWAIGKPPAHGTARIDAKSGKLEFMPLKDWSGSDAVTVVVRDAAVTIPSVVAITVTPVNDAPTTKGLKLATKEDEPGFATVAANDIDGDALKYSIEPEPAKGSATVSSDGLVTYTPSADFNGADRFGVLVADSSASATAMVEVDVRPINDAPVVAEAKLAGTEDEIGSVTVTASDVDGDALTWAIGKPPVHGTARIDAKSGKLELTPQKDWNGADAVTVTVKDAALSASTVVAITIAPTNDAPVAQGLKLSTKEDEAVSGTVIAKDIDGDALTFTLGDKPARGVVTVGEGGKVTYTPNADTNGADRFVIVVSDGKASANAQVDVEVKPINDAPVVAEAKLSGVEDTLASLTLSASDVDGDALTWSITKPPSHGTARVDPKTGQLELTPQKDWSGADAVTVAVKDAALAASTVVAITIAPANDAPVAQGLKLSTKEDEAVSGAIVAKDIDGDALTFSVGDAPAHGTATVAAGGAVTYTPAPDSNGADHFTIVVSDGQAKVSAVVDVQVRAINDAPVVAEAALSGDEDAVLSVALSASDVDGDAVTWSLLKPPAHGTARLDAKSGKLDYTPPKDWNGADSLTVTAKDVAISVNAVVPITVTAVNDTPVAQGLKLSGKEDEAVSGAVIAKDIDGDALTFTLGDKPARGTVTLGDAGKLTYTPNPDANGADRFVIVVSDGKASANAQVDVELRAVNDAPVVSAAELSGSEDEVASVTLSATDVDGDVVTWSLLKPPAHGTARLDAKSGKLELTLPKDWNGA
ncbi:MAG: tandem-95 repeat protein, partial [Archangium sp.]|nr:tandem-95 repeat protein [Archangium sp.]